MSEVGNSEASDGQDKGLTFIWIVALKYGHSLSCPTIQLPNLPHPFLPSDGFLYGVGWQEDHTGTGQGFTIDLQEDSKFKTDILSYWKTGKQVRKQLR